MKNFFIPDVRQSNTVIFVFSLIFAFLGSAEFAFCQSVRGGSGTMAAPYWVREKDEVTGYRRYESFTGQTIIDNSGFFGGLWIKDVIIKQKQVEIDRRRPENEGNAVLNWGGYYKEDSILQVYDSSGIKIFDGSQFKRWVVKDFTNFSNPDLGHIGRWIKHFAQYQYVRTPTGDVTASGTEIRDNSYANQPNYNLNLQPAKSTEFSFAICGEEFWQFSFRLQDLGNTIWQGSTFFGGPALPPTDPFFEITDYLDWVMGGRAAASFASYAMDNISNSLYDADPIVIMSDVELRRRS